MKNQKLAVLCLMWAMFFLPFGYDALFKMIMDWTGSYWTTDLIFYCLSVVLFGLYFYYSKTNPFRFVRDRIVNTYTKAACLINLRFKK